MAYKYRVNNDLWRLVDTKLTKHRIDNELHISLGLTMRQTAIQMNEPKSMEMDTVKKLAELLGEKLQVMIFHYGCGLKTIDIEALLNELGIDPDKLEANVPKLVKSPKTQPA